MASEHIHLIGIGGTGMTSLAGLLRAQGCRVSGSDGKLYPPTSRILAGMDIEVGEGFDPARLHPAPDLVVVGNAISRGNPELEELLDVRLAYTSMPRLIAKRFLRGKHSIVVAGTHGKTTTASMLAWVLTRAGRDPGFFIGGAPLNFDLPFRLGRGAAFVIEGDEYDTAFFDKGPKFMHYRPDTVLLGTVEFDHADIFRDVDEIRTAFRRLINLVPRRGLIVRHEESPLAVEVSAAALSRVEGYGQAAGLWRASRVAPTDEGIELVVEREGRPFVELLLPMMGLYNVRNALAVIAAAHEQGLEPARIAEGLATFRGVRRRLELRGEQSGVRVYDDFAHHPTAIRETLEAARHRFGDRRIWAVLEPRSWSLRRNVFQERLSDSFGAADRVIVASVFGAEAVPETQRLDVPRLVDSVTRRGTPAEHLPDATAIVEHLGRQARDGDVVIVMSNGSFDGLHGRLLDALRARVEAPRTG